jgi:hypothetical protein
MVVTANAAREVLPPEPTQEPSEYRRDTVARLFDEYAMEQERWPGSKSQWDDLCDDEKANAYAAADKIISLVLVPEPTQEQVGRVETGPVRIGDDWPGVFVRGDDAMHYAIALSGRTKPEPVGGEVDMSDLLTDMTIETLMNLLASCREPCGARPLYASPVLAQEREPARLHDPRDHTFLPPSGLYCAICGMDAEAHVATEHTGGENG